MVIENLEQRNYANTSRIDHALFTEIEMAGVGGSLGIMNEYRDKTKFFLNQDNIKPPTEKEVKSEKAGRFEEGSRDNYWRKLSDDLTVVIKVTDLEQRPTYSAAREIEIKHRVAGIFKKIGVEVEEPIAFFHDHDNKKAYLIVKYIPGKALRSSDRRKDKLRFILGEARAIGVYPSDLRIDDLIEGNNGKLYLVDMDTWNMD